ncbi:MAG: cyclase family protein [Firmicutes bacterium]|nr:cyclase family protein [Bacillota bacterium]
MGKTYDISMGIHEDLVTYKGNPPPQRTMLMDLARGDQATVSHWSLGAHAGTHVDAPSHFLPGGRTVDVLPWHYYCARVMVWDCGNETAITSQVVERALNGSVTQQVEGILFRTQNSMHLTEPFSSDYVSLDVSAARRIVESKLRLVGIDYLSIERYGDDSFPVHKILLTADVAIVEGLYLAHVPSGIYRLYCLPIKLMGADGAPARAVLVEEEVP